MMGHRMGLGALPSRLGNRIPVRYWRNQLFFSLTLANFAVLDASCDERGCIISLFDLRARRGASLPPPIDYQPKAFSDGYRQRILAS